MAVCLCLLIQQLLVPMHLASHGFGCGDGSGTDVAQGSSLQGARLGHSHGSHHGGHDHGHDHDHGGPLDEEEWHDPHPLQDHFDHFVEPAGLPSQIGVIHALAPTHVVSGPQHLPWIGRVIEVACPPRPPPERRSAPSRAPPRVV